MLQIFTIGHSTRTLENLISVLKYYKIEQLIDIRHFPQSGHNPQFNKDVMEKELMINGIAYTWLEKLGGFREGGYLEYMKTKEFSEGIEDLKNIAAEKKTAIMCAELLWFKCHRRCVSDVLTKKGFAAVHIFDEKKSQQHAKKENRIKCDLISATKDESGSLRTTFKQVSF